eukprot:CAMPEP_0115008326 /NCGR_PEP_ID=MMETSP0216-20121206/21840_1 /TAXON_ID=223996 /ORGANISM="Protocruzia adherens, Strain Boccale" /LENGTH=155 /DNA_ID=CAMNT_0002375701 /DNA_START=12 /DNA_END=479 /DNA_ORIENTATION=+
MEPTNTRVHNGNNDTNSGGSGGSFWKKAGGKLQGLAAMTAGAIKSGASKAEKELNDPNFAQNCKEAAKSSAVYMQQKAKDGYDKVRDPKFQEDCKSAAVSSATYIQEKGKELGSKAKKAYDEHQQSTGGTGSAAGAGASAGTGPNPGMGGNGPSA